MKNVTTESIRTLLIWVMEDTNKCRQWPHPKAMVETFENEFQVINSQRAKSIQNHLHAQQ